MRISRVFVGDITENILVSFFPDTVYSDYSICEMKWNFAIFTTFCHINCVKFFSTWYLVVIVLCIYTHAQFPQNVATKVAVVYWHNLCFCCCVWTVTVSLHLRQLTSLYCHCRPVSWRWDCLLVLVLSMYLLWSVLVLWILIIFCSCCFSSTW